MNRLVVASLALVALGASAASAEAPLSSNAVSPLSPNGTRHLADVASPREWNFDLAVKLAQMCAISYCPQDDVQKWQCVGCDRFLHVHNVHVDPDKGYQSYVADNGADTVIVVFKGTDPLSLKQWITDLTASHSPTSFSSCSGCEVHKGFSDAEHAMWPDMESALRAAIDRLGGGSNIRVIIAGHSLGAAISTLFSYRMARVFSSRHIEHYSFGNPRVGNKAFAASYDGTPNLTAFRVSHRRDPVPHLPLQKMGYWHHGLLIYCADAVGRECVSMPNSEEDGAIPLFGGHDHGVYMGIDFFPYLDISSQEACR